MATLPYRDEVLADQPIAYWRLGEASGTMAKDETGHITDGTYSGGVTLGQPGALTGDPDTAAAFDGQTGRLDSSSSTLDFTGVMPYSVELWARPTKMPTTGYERIISKEHAAGNRQGYFVSYSPPGGIVSFERWSNQMGEGAVTPAIPLNVWTHIVGTYDGTQLAIYANGALAMSIPSSRQLLPVSEPFSVGTFSGNMLSDYFAGSVDEVAVYDHALTAARVMTHFWARVH
jgi:hypothetical protein